MVLEYLPKSARTKSPSFVSFYIPTPWFASGGESWSDVQNRIFFSASDAAMQCDAGICRKRQVTQRLLWKTTYAGALGYLWLVDEPPEIRELSARIRISSAKKDHTKSMICRIKLIIFGMMPIDEGRFWSGKELICGWEKMEWHPTLDTLKITGERLHGLIYCSTTWWPPPSPYCHISLKLDPSVRCQNGSRVPALWNIWNTPPKPWVWQWIYVLQNSKGLSRETCFPA